MKKYFYRTGHRSNGPFTYKELIELPLEKDTGVREQGCDHWKNASEFEELKYLFTAGYTSPIIDMPPARRIPTVVLWALTGLVTALFLFSLFSYRAA